MPKNKPAPVFWCLYHRERAAGVKIKGGEGPYLWTSKKSAAEYLKRWRGTLGMGWAPVKVRLVPEVMKCK